MPAISFRIEHKARSGVGGQRRHDLRVGPQPAYVDADRSELNSVLIEPRGAAEMHALALERRAVTGKTRGMKSTAAVVTNGILTFSRDAQPIVDALDIDDQDRRIRESCEAAAAALGVELTGLVVHRDEEAIHAHCQMPSRRMADGQPLSMVIKPADTRALQDTAAAAWEDLGITRGKPKAERIADGEPVSAWRHRTVKQLHEDLPREIEDLQAQRDRLAAQLHKDTQRAESAREKLDQASADAKKAEQLRKRLATYERRAEARQAELDALDARLAGAKKAGGRIGAFVGAVREAVTGRTKALQRRLSLAERKSAKAVRIARDRGKALQSEREKSQAANGRLAAKDQALGKIQGELTLYRTAAKGLGPDALRPVVQRGLDAGRDQGRRPDLEL